jgi:hypothetical protein
MEPFFDGVQCRKTSRAGHRLFLTQGLAVVSHVHRTGVLWVCGFQLFDRPDPVHGLCQSGDAVCIMGVDHIQTGGPLLVHSA